MATIHYMSAVSGGSYLREILPKMQIAGTYSTARAQLARFPDKMIMTHQLTANNTFKGASRLLRDPAATAEALYKFETSYFADEISPEDFLDIPLSYSVGGLFNLGAMEEYYLAGYIVKMNDCHIFRLEEIRRSPEKFIAMLTAMGFERDPEVVTTLVNEQIQIDKSNGIPRSGACVYPAFESRAALLAQILNEDFGYSRTSNNVFSTGTNASAFTKQEFHAAAESLLKFSLAKIPFFQSEQAIQGVSLCFLQIFSQAQLFPIAELMLAWSLAYFHDAENAAAMRIFDIHFENASRYRKYFIAMLRATIDKRFVLMAQRLHNNYFLPNLTDLGRRRLEVDMLKRQRDMDNLCRGYSLL